MKTLCPILLPSAAPRRRELLVSSRSARHTLGPLCAAAEATSRTDVEQSVAVLRAAAQSGSPPAAAVCAAMSSLEKAKAFPVEQLLIINYDDLQTNPNTTINTVLQHIGLPALDVSAGADVNDFFVSRKGAKTQKRKERSRG